MNTTAKISWMASGEPYSEQFQDFYFSTDGGLQETEYVFLKQNDCLQRFEALKNIPGKNVFRIGETGFGTGLNFLVTAYHWLQVLESQENELNNTLEYIAVEQYPLTRLQLKQVYETFKTTWPQLSFCCLELLAHYQDNSSSNQFKLFDGKIILKLIIEDAAEGLTQFLHSQNKKQNEKQNKIDAWYLDGFAPAKNPDMWTMELFKTLFDLSKAGTTLSTFTSAGIVRRGLIEAGFDMTKVPGLGKKREILSGIKA